MHDVQNKELQITQQAIDQSLTTVSDALKGIARTILQLAAVNTSPAKQNYKAILDTINDTRAVLTDLTTPNSQKATPAKDSTQPHPTENETSSLALGA